MTVYPKIESWDDYRIRNREYSQGKLFNDFFNLDCDKSYTNLVDYLHVHLGLSTRRKDINSLINTFQNIGLITVINSSVEKTNKLPKFLKSLRKNIIQFDEKHRFIDEFNVMTDNSKEKEVKL